MRSMRRRGRAAAKICSRTRRSWTSFEGRCSGTCDMMILLVVVIRLCLAVREQRPTSACRSLPSRRCRTDRDRDILLPPARMRPSSALAASWISPATVKTTSRTCSNSWLQSYDRRLLFADRHGIGSAWATLEVQRVRDLRAPSRFHATSTLSSLRYVPIPEAPVNERQAPASLLEMCREDKTPSSTRSRPLLLGHAVHEDGVTGGRRAATGHGSGHGDAHDGAARTRAACRRAANEEEAGPHRPPGLGDRRPAHGRPSTASAAPRVRARARDRGRRRERVVTLPRRAPERAARRRCTSRAVDRAPPAPRWPHGRGARRGPRARSPTWACAHAPPAARPRRGRTGAATCCWSRPRPGSGTRALLSPCRPGRDRAAARRRRARALAPLDRPPSAASAPAGHRARRTGTMSFDWRLLLAPEEISTMSSSTRSATSR